MHKYNKEFSRRTAMKSFKQVLGEVAEPKPEEEKAFKDQHSYEVRPHPVALDHQFTGAIGADDLPREKAKRLADQDGDANYDNAYDDGFDYMGPTFDEAVQTRLGKAELAEVELDESVEINEAVMDQKMWDQTKKGDKLAIGYDSGIKKGSKTTFVVGTKNIVGKAKVGKITMKREDGKGGKFFLYNRNGKISLALGDMAASMTSLVKEDLDAQPVDENMKLINRIKNSGVVKSGSMSKDKEADRKKAVKAFKDIRGGKYKGVKFANEEVELDEMKQGWALIDTADGNKVKALSSGEQGVKQSRTSAERPPMSVKDKNTLKIVKLKKAVGDKQASFMIGSPLKEEVELDERNYANEYANYHSKPEQIANRSSRNKARRIMAKENDVDGMDVGHADNNPLNNDPANLRIENPSDNRREPRMRNEGKNSNYELYHKDFSGAMQTAYAHAKKNLGIIVDPSEIDDKVASGPRKPSTGKTNSYRLTDKSGKKAIQVQVYNTGKSYELNMYKESAGLSDALNSLEEAFTDSDAPAMIKVLQDGIKAPFVQASHSKLGGADKPSIGIKVSLDAQADWPNKIYNNAAYGTFMMHMTPTSNSLELIVFNRQKVAKFRKAKFKDAKDVVMKINKWVEASKKMNEEAEVETLDEAPKTIKLRGFGPDHKKASGSSLKKIAGMKEAKRRFGKKGAPKITGDSIAIQRAKDAEHNAAMGRTKTGRKKPVRTMTSTQKSLASMRRESVELDEAFKAGGLKLNDGKQVMIKKDDAIMLNDLMKQLSKPNVKKMTDTLMKDKKGFTEILGFAKDSHE